MSVGGINRFEKMSATGYFIGELLVAGLWTIIESLGVVDMARLGMDAERQWRCLTGKKGSHHA